MTITVLDGFDLYNGVGVNTGLQAKWTLGNVNGTSLLAMAAGRFGGQCLQCTGGANFQQVVRSLTAGASFGFGFALRFTAMPSVAASSIYHLSVLSNATYTFGLNVSSTGQISVYRATGGNAGVLLGTSAANVILANTWHFVEVALVINAATGSVVVKVDGTTVLNLAAQNTANGVATANNLALGQTNSAGANGTFQWDDLYITDGATIGERRIQSLYPNADTAQKDFTPNVGVTNYTQVKEAQCDGDTSYVQGSVVGNTDRYDFDDLTGAPATIDAVQISVFAEKTDATARSIALQAKSGATISDGANFALAASYAKLERLMLLDPNGNIAWAAAAVNALQGGPKVTV